MIPYTYDYKEFNIHPLAQEQYLKYTKDQYTLLRKGFKSTSMDDKWNLEWEDDNTILFIRSWTGYTPYKMIGSFKDNMWVFEKVVSCMKDASVNDWCKCNNVIKDILELKTDAHSNIR